MNGFAALTTGLGLGLIYFYGLWLTVRLGMGGGRARFLVAVSHLGRTALAGVVFFAVSQHGWQLLLAALAGFALARWHLVRQLTGGLDGNS